MPDAFAAARRTMRGVNPAADEVSPEFNCHSDDEVESILQAASVAAVLQRQRSYPERASRMRRADAFLRDVVRNSER